MDWLHVDSLPNSAGAFSVLPFFAGPQESRRDGPTARHV